MKNSELVFTFPINLLITIILKLQTDAFSKYENATES